MASWELPKRGAHRALPLQGSDCLQGIRCSTLALDHRVRPWMASRHLLRRRVLLIITARQTITLRCGFTGCVLRMFSVGMKPWFLQLSRPSYVALL